MTEKQLRGEDLLRLQKEKGNICVSIVIPVHQLSPERRVDELEVKKAIKRAEELLQYKYPGSNEINGITNSLDKLYRQLDFTHNLDGLGLFVSPGVEFAVQFPFQVEEKIMVGSNFEIRDLVRKINYSIPYYTLVITEHGGRLFEGLGDDLTEINDNNFPVGYEDSYEYSKPSRSSSYAGYSHVKIFEKDKSELEAIRLSAFFRKLDELLDTYLISDTPLVIMGVEKELSLFSKVSGHQKNIVAKIPGSYANLNEKELAELAWPAIRLHLENVYGELIKEFVEKIGERHAISGIQDVWSATREGKGFKLLVELDYRCPGFLIENEEHLYLKPPQKPHSVLPDVVDDIIEMILEKNGKVYFVGNGALEGYGRIGLITRW